MINEEILVRKYEKYFSNVKRLLILSGAWPNDYPIVTRITSCLAIFTTFVTATAILNFVIHHITNVMILTKGFGLLISIYTAFMKVSIFLLHRDDLIYLNDVLTAKFHSDLKNKDHRPIALARTPAFIWLSYTLTIAVGCTYILSYVILIITLRRGKYILIYPAIFPFKYTPGGPVYWVLQCIEMLGGFFLWTITSGVDSSFGIYTLQVCGELRVLAYKFERLSSSENYKEDLKECIERHHMLMKSKDTLQKVFGLLAIWLAVTSAMVQCTLVFQVMQSIKHLGVGIIYIIFYITLKLIQAFAYAWYGHLICEESESCLNAIYNAKWAGSGDARFMRDVLIVLSQRPLVFRAKSCMPLKMEVFSKIVNTSVSYFFLLQTLEEGSQQ